MRTFEVTSPGLRRNGEELALGSTVKADTLEAGMVGKVREVEVVRELEVSTPSPQRGRPKKKHEEESPE